MPNQDDEDPIEEHHDDLSPTERKVLKRVAHGETDEEIAERDKMTVVAVRSSVRRFRDRTGLHGRQLTAWAVKHEPCCIFITSQGR